MNRLLSEQKVRIFFFGIFWGMEKQLLGDILWSFMSLFVKNIMNSYLLKENNDSLVARPKQTQLSNGTKKVKPKRFIEITLTWQPEKRELSFYILLYKHRF